MELTPRLRMRRPDTQLHDASCALQPMSPPSLMCADQSTVSTAENRFDAAHTDQSAILEEMLLQQVSALLTVCSGSCCGSPASLPSRSHPVVSSSRVQSTLPWVDHKHSGHLRTPECVHD